MKTGVGGVDKKKERFNEGVDDIAPVTGQKLIIIISIMRKVVKVITQTMSRERSQRSIKSINEVKQGKKKNQILRRSWKGAREPGGVE